jgi:cell division protein FtsL
MRVLLIFIIVVVFLFALVYIESELVKLEVRKEQLSNQVIELENEKRRLEFEVMDLSNLAVIEREAKQRGFVYPDEDDVLGAVP